MPRPRKNRNRRPPPGTPAWQTDPLAPIPLPSIYQQAGQMANDQIQPSLDAARELAKVRAQNITAFSSELAKILGSLGAQSQQTFQSTAAGQDLFSKGFAQQLTDQPNLTPGAAAVSEALGGYLQGLSGIGQRALGQKGAAEATLESLFPAFAAQRGAESLRLSEQQAGRDVQDLLRRAPELRAQILDRLLQRELDKASAYTTRDIAYKQYGLERDKFRQSAYESNRDYTEGVRRFNAQLDLDYTRLRQDQNQFNATLEQRRQEAIDDALASGDTQRAEALQAGEDAYWSSLDSARKVAEQASVEGGPTLTIVTSVPGKAQTERMMDESGSPLFYELDENGRRKIDPVKGGYVMTLSESTLIDPISGAKIDNAPAYTTTYDMQETTKTVKTPKKPLDLYKLLYASYAPMLMQRYKLSKQRVMGMIYEAMRPYYPGMPEFSVGPDGKPPAWYAQGTGARRRTAR